MWGGGGGGEQYIIVKTEILANATAYLFKCLV